jgi:HD-like signal output (HDOD) protein
MAEQVNKNETFWLELIKTTELGAMAGTLDEIQNLISDENSTVKQLADIILRDVTLATRVLSIANSIVNPNQQNDYEGSLTQAIVKIGFQGLRAICISASIMDRILKNSNHQQEIISCLNESFENAIHARNIAEKTGAAMEDVFIAGLLQNIGEVIFWCSPIPDRPEYQELLKYAVDTPEQALKKLSGLDFDDMSAILTTDWNLSELLQQTLNGEITRATKAVFLGRRITQASKHGWESKEINTLLQTQLKELDFDIMSGIEFIKQGCETAKGLSKNYPVAKQTAPTEKSTVKNQSDEPSQLDDMDVDIPANKNKKSNPVNDLDFDIPTEESDAKEGKEPPPLDDLDFDIPIEENKEPDPLDDLDFDLPIDENEDKSDDKKKPDKPTSLIRS